MSDLETRIEKLEAALQVSKPSYVRIFFDTDGYYDANGKPFDLDAPADVSRLILPRKQIDPLPATV